MTLRDRYLAMLERTPASLQPAVRGAATGVRHARRAVQRTRRRIARVSARGALTVEARVRRTPRGRRVLNRVQTAQNWGPVALLRRWLLRPLVHIPGAHFTLVDATGVAAASVAVALPSPAPRHLVVITDDPDLVPLRAVGALYEYVPGFAVEAGDLGIGSARLLHLQRVYGAAAPVRLEQLLGAGPTS
jgi:hypothetical protein